jgi:outer membrane protease
MDGQHRLYTDQNKIIATLLRDRSKMSDEDWEQSFRDNVWATFSAEESLALNIVHKILKPKPKSITLGETKYGIER